MRHNLPEHPVAIETPLPGDVLDRTDLGSQERGQTRSAVADSLEGIDTERRLTPRQVVGARKMMSMAALVAALAACAPDIHTVSETKVEADGRRHLRTVEEIHEVDSSGLWKMGWYMKWYGGSLVSLLILAQLLLKHTSENAESLVKSLFTGKTRTLKPGIRPKLPWEFPVFSYEGNYGQKVKDIMFQNWEVPYTIAPLRSSPIVPGEDPNKLADKDYIFEDTIEVDGIDGVRSGHPVQWRASIQWLPERKVLRNNPANPAQHFEVVLPSTLPRLHARLGIANREITRVEIANRVHAAVTHALQNLPPAIVWGDPNQLRQTINGPTEWYNADPNSTLPYMPADAIMELFQQFGVVVNISMIKLDQSPARAAAATRTINANADAEATIAAAKGRDAQNQVDAAQVHRMGIANAQVAAQMGAVTAQNLAVTQQALATAPSTVQAAAAAAVVLAPVVSSTVAIITSSATRPAISPGLVNPSSGGNRP